jgi:hypothetical protein
MTDQSRTFRFVYEGLQRAGAGNKHQRRSKETNSSLRLMNSNTTQGTLETNPILGNGLVGF